MDSILTSVKKLLGIAEDYTAFDMDIILHINSVFMILTQMGVGPFDGFSISDASTTWDEFVDDGPLCEGVKSYAAAKVRMLFDPPQSSSTMEALKSVIAELEYRLYVLWDNYENGNGFDSRLNIATDQEVAEILAEKIP